MRTSSFLVGLALALIAISTPIQASAQTERWGRGSARQVARVAAAAVDSLIGGTPHIHFSTNADIDVSNLSIPRVLEGRASIGDSREALSCGVDLAHCEAGPLFVDRENAALLHLVSTGAKDGVIFTQFAGVHWRGTDQDSVGFSVLLEFERGSGNRLRLKSSSAAYR